MPRSVLIVDDTVFMRRLLRDVLLREGFSVREAVGGRDAIEAYVEARPDVVLMDVAMPDIDGLEATRQIRTHDPEARIVVVSAMPEECGKSTAFEAGACAYLAKPFQPVQLVDAVRSCMER